MKCFSKRAFENFIPALCTVRVSEAGAEAEAEAEAGWKQPGSCSKQLVLTWVMRSSGNNVFLKQSSAVSMGTQNTAKLGGFFFLEISTHTFEDKNIPLGTSGTMHNNN